MYLSAHSAQLNDIEFANEGCSQRIMSEKFGVEDEYAKEALGTAVEVMRMQGETRERLSAARLILDFTKQKPVAKSEVAVAKAEDFLASLITEEDDGPKASSGS